MSELGWEQGFVGEKRDIAPNEAYTVRGVGRMWTHEFDPATTTAGRAPRVERRDGETSYRKTNIAISRIFAGKTALTLEEANEVGFLGVEEDWVPNENYSVAGVLAGLPTPENGFGGVWRGLRVTLAKPDEEEATA